MKVEEIERLLAGFYDGKTTEDEEEALKSYFETQDVPQQLLIDKKLFLSFHSFPYPEVPARLEDQLVKLIDANAAEERQIFLKNRTRRNWKWVGSIAACLILLLGLSFGLLNFREKSPKDTFTDPQEAYRALHAALTEVSANLNNGIDQLAESREQIKEISNEIIKEIN